jgi:hypothetical protein
MARREQSHAILSACQGKIKAHRRKTIEKEAFLPLAVRTLVRNLDDRGAAWVECKDAQPGS